MDNRDNTTHQPTRPEGHRVTSFSNRPIPKLESTPTHRKQMPASRPNRPISRNCLWVRGSRVPAGTVALRAREESEGSPARQCRERVAEIQSAASAANTFGAIHSAALYAKAQWNPRIYSRPSSPACPERSRRATRHCKINRYRCMNRIGSNSNLLNKTTLSNRNYLAHILRSSPPILGPQEVSPNTDDRQKTTIRRGRPKPANQ